MPFQDPTVLIQQTLISTVQGLIGAGLMQKHPGPNYAPNITYEGIVGGLPKTAEGKSVVREIGRQVGKVLKR